MWLVARVDDRPLQGGLQADLGLEEVRPLRDLIAVPGSLVPRRLTAELPRPAEDLPAHEERREPRDQVRERHLPVHQIVLVRAVRVALAVAVVLVDRELLAPGHRAANLVEGAFEHALPRLV